MFYFPALNIEIPTDSVQETWDVYGQFYDFDPPIDISEDANATNSATGLLAVIYYGQELFFVYSTSPMDGPDLVFGTDGKSHSLLITMHFDPISVRKFPACELKAKALKVILDKNLPDQDVWFYYAQWGTPSDTTA